MGAGKDGPLRPRDGHGQENRSCDGKPYQGDLVQDLEVEEMRSDIGGDRRREHNEGAASAEFYSLRLTWRSPSEIGAKLSYRSWLARLHQRECNHDKLEATGYVIERMSSGADDGNA